MNFKHEKEQLACNRYIQVITGHRIYCQICDDFCQNLHLNYWYTQGHWCTPTRLFQLQDVKCVLCPHLLCHIILLLWLKFSGQMCDFLVMLNCHILKISNVTMIMVVQCLENLFNVTLLIWQQIQPSNFIVHNIFHLFQSPRLAFLANDMVLLWCYIAQWIAIDLLSVMIIIDVAVRMMIKCLGYKLLAQI